MSIGVESGALWISSPNTIKLHNNGTNTFTIDSSGNVGIENINTSYKLTVSGATSSKSITLNKNNVDTTGNSLNFYYNSPGTSFVNNGFTSANPGAIIYYYLLLFC